MPRRKERRDSGPSNPLFLQLFFRLSTKNLGHKQKTAPFPFFFNSEFFTRQFRAPVFQKGGNARRWSFLSLTNLPHFYFNKGTRESNKKHNKIWIQNFFLDISSNNDDETTETLQLFLLLSRHFPFFLRGTCIFYFSRYLRREKKRD